MANYRRLISYIYAYEGGVKGKNIGFAKIEIREHQCRIHVNVKKVFVGSNDIGVYLLSAGSEIPLGKIFVRNGTGEFRISVQTENVENSGISMDQCYGLTIHDVESAWRCYTTIWEDAVAQAAELELEHVTAEQVRSADTQKEEEYPEYLPVSEEIAKELEQEAQELELEAPWEGTVEADPQAEEMAVLAQEQAVMEAEPQQQEVELHMPQKLRQEETPIPPEPEDPAKLKELDRLEKEETSRSHLWDRMAGNYVKVLAFDYDNGCEILSIKPQDIGLLPREIWTFGNNSFLLHGYYNYRHLILARLHNPQGAPRYLLGVPGHYFSNEKYMASMFGFPHFVLAKKQPEEDGRFGYWYTDIRL